MSKLKDPALVLSSANTIGLIGVSVWLYKLNSSLADQVRHLSDAVNDLAGRFDGTDHEIQRIYAISQNTRNHVGQLQLHMGEVFHELEYYQSCAEALEKQAKITNAEFSLPAFPRNKKPVVTLDQPTNSGRRTNEPNSRKTEAPSRRTNDHNRRTSRRNRKEESSEEESSENEETEESSEEEEEPAPSRKGKKRSADAPNVENDLDDVRKSRLAKRKNTHRRR